MTRDIGTRGLWFAFVALFGLVAVASVLPVRPLVVVFPAWSLLVLAAVAGTVLVAVVAVRQGWPRGENA